jgi:hypothetical protein
MADEDEYQEPGYHCGRVAHLGPNSFAEIPDSEKLQDQHRDPRVLRILNMRGLTCYLGSSQDEDVPQVDEDHNIRGTPY